MASFVFVKWLSGHFSVTGGLAVTTFSLTKSIFFNDIFLSMKKWICHEIEFFFLSMKKVICH